VRLEGLGQLINRMPSSEIEPATFLLVAEYLNQQRYRAPLFESRRAYKLLIKKFNAATIAFISPRFTWILHLLKIFPQFFLKGVAYP
jgi:hypothetical protein